MSAPFAVSPSPSKACVCKCILLCVGSESEKNNVPVGMRPFPSACCGLQGMISIKTLSKLAQLRHEGVMLVCTEAFPHS